ncbi:MAG: hypothetical protein WAX89_07245 [Alphaproteobacteria bacterium]
MTAYTPRQKLFHQLNLRVIELRAALRDVVAAYAEVPPAIQPALAQDIQSIQAEIAVLDEQLAYLLAHKDWQDDE